MLRTDSEEASCELVHQQTIQNMQQKFTAMVPVIKDLYAFWLEKNHEKLDILEECDLMLQMFEKISSKDMGAATRWNIKRPRPKESPLTSSISAKKESAAVFLGDSRVKVKGADSPAENPMSKELTKDEQERLEIFKKRTKNSRDKIKSDSEERVPRLTRSAKTNDESVEIKVYINDLKYRNLIVQTYHSKNDLCQLAIQSFKLDQSYPYTLSLWRDFKQNLEIKESGEATPFKLYFKEVANDPSKLFHIHRIKPPKKTETKPIQLGPNMENYKVPEASPVIYISPKREANRRVTVVYGINSATKQAPVSLQKIRATTCSPVVPVGISEKMLNKSVKQPLKNTSSKQFMSRNRNVGRGEMSPNSPNL